MSKFKNVIIIIYMQERKRNTQTYSTVSGNTIDSNVFLLKKIVYSATSTGVSIDFSPYKKTERVEDSANESTFPSVPVFNKDGRYYTPCFIFVEDIAKFNENQELCLNSHIRKVKELEEEKTQMYLPKPSKTNSFCQICREPFDQYLTHINRPTHLKKMKNSEFYQDIQELCNKMNPHPKLPKQKKIKKDRKKKDSMPALRKKNSAGKSTESLSTGLQSQQYGQVVA